MNYSKKQSLSLFRDSGSILIISMWVLVCFSILSVGLYSIVSSRLKLAETLQGRIVGQYLAKAAFAHFKIYKNKYKASPSSIFKEKHTQELGRGKFIYTVNDEGNKININTSSIDILSELPGFDKELAKKVSESKFKPFHVKEELLLVEDIDDEIFNKCKDLITTYASGGVNINTATPQVLSILGIDEDLASVIINFRAGEDSMEGTADDGVFENTSEIINKLRSYTTLYEAQEAKLIQLISQNMLSASSDTFSLQIETTVLERPVMRYNIIVDKENKIKQWTEM